MWRNRVSVACIALTLMLLFPAAAFPHHPHSEYDPTVAPWIGVAISGGGLRAAAFSHGVLLELRKLCLIRPQEQSSVSHDEESHEAHSPHYSFHYLEDTEYSDDDQESPCGKGGGASFLDNVHFLSGVSGGAITAAYYRTHPDQLTEFTQKLKDARLGWELFTGEKSTPVWRPPLMLLASMLDTLFQTFKLPLLPIPEIEVAPFATMALYDGLFESEQLAHVYRDLFFSKTTFEDLERSVKSDPTLSGAVLGNGNHKQETGIGQANLLINATDIANGRILTFDKETFACLGSMDDFRKLQLNVAVAASSSLPGVFSPLHLKSYITKTDSKRIPTFCPLILGNQVRSPVLVDGGVSDNLGVTGLLRVIFQQKNKNGLQKDDPNIPQGQTLAISESEEIKITRPLLSSKDRTPLPIVQRENPKSQKSFLLIVNAGVTANSSLPKLAGHLDNSFDVLIRDRTDLSRVIAQRLLANFGFGVVELNMRDLVKSNRVVSRIVRLALAKQRTLQITDKSVRKIAQTFDFTEMERKVLDDLNQISFLPSKEEIDTLILAGRAVVAEKSDLIKREYERLVDKNYSASCESIINPDRHYCWHSSFETPHLAANKVGILLDVLTRTSEDFSRKVSKNRSDQLIQTKHNLLDLYLDESRALEDLMELPVALERAETNGGDSIAPRKWKIIQACLIQRHHDYVAVRKGEEEIKKIPICSLLRLTEQQQNDLLKNAPAWLKEFPEIEIKQNGEPEAELWPEKTRVEIERDEWPKIQAAIQKYISDLLNPDELLPDFEHTHVKAVEWADTVIKHMIDHPANPAEAQETQIQSPTYYAVLSRFLMLRKRFDEGFHYLYMGAMEFPYDPELSYLLGYYAIHLNRDFQGGLKHLASAIEKARGNQQQIDLLPHSGDNSLPEESRSTLRYWFSRAEARYELRSARYTALSSSPLQGRSEFVPNEAVSAWLNQTFPDGHGGNDLSTLLRFAEQSKSISEPAVSALVCRVQKTLEKISLTDVTVAITKFLEAYGGCLDNEDHNIDDTSPFEADASLNAAPCGDIYQKGLLVRDTKPPSRLTACKTFAKVQLTIRELLAPQTAVAYARAQARKLYETHPTNTKSLYPPYLWERADVSGLILLLDAIQKQCPQRDEDVRTAQRLFHVASAAISTNEDRRFEERYGLHEKVKARIHKLQHATNELACSRRHFN